MIDRIIDGESERVAVLSACRPTEALLKLSFIRDHLETYEKELIGDVGGEKSGTEQSSDHGDKGALLLEVVRCGPSKVEIVGDVRQNGGQLRVPVVVVEDEVILFTHTGGGKELGVAKRSPEVKVVPGDVGNDVHSSVEDDGKLLLCGSFVGAHDVQVQIQATIGLVTNNNALYCVHGDRLGVGLFREGQYTLTVGINTVVSVELSDEDEDLGLESLARKCLLDHVEGGVDHRLVDPKLFLLLLACIVSIDCISGNVSAQI